MNQKGYTLLQVLIVVAIVGILSTVALPAYQDYTIRARVAEGFSLVSTAQIAVAETTMVNNALPLTQAATGYVSPSATANVSGIAIAANGVITITYTAAAGGGTIVVTPTLQANGDITWNCTGGTLLDKYRPATCR